MSKSNWQETGKKSYDVVDKLTEVATLGVLAAPEIREVKNTETGAVKNAVVYEGETTGSAISKGRLRD